MTLEAVVGRLVLHPGATPSVTCERPMVGAALLGRLTEGRRVSLLPDLLGSVFVLCAHAQRSTARRAIKAALGLEVPAADVARDRMAIAMHVARDHLQRLALELPALVPHGTGMVSASWLRDAPVLSLPATATAVDEPALHATAESLPGWLARRLFGMPVTEWLEAWHAEHGAWLDRWSSAQMHPVTQWLHAVRDEAQAIAWPCRTLDVLAEGASGMRELGLALANEARFAERPTWRGLPAETGSWTRLGRQEPALTLWDRLGARIADLAWLGAGASLATGALAVAEGEGIAWTEMSRGLLVHWVRLEPGARDPSTARAESYRVLAPTEWNFHPAGAFGRLLSAGSLNAAQTRLAAAALDPCLPFTLDPVPPRA